MKGILNKTLKAGIAIGVAAGLWKIMKVVAEELCKEEDVSDHECPIPQPAKATKKKKSSKKKSK